jgi:hypothetical protein
MNIEHTAKTLTLTTLTLGLVLLAGPLAAEPHDAVDPAAAELLGASDHLGIDWAMVHHTTEPVARRSSDIGRFSFADLYGGIEAVVLEDVISAGVAVDMSALAGAPTLAESRVYNGPVAAAHDLGNAYVYTTFNEAGELVLYAGVERLGVVADTFIEFEFNQDRVGVTSGNPSWPIRGARTADDLKVRLEIVAGEVAAVEISRWAVGEAGEGAFEPVADAGGLRSSACGGEPTRFLYCVGRAPVSARHEVYDAAGQRLEAVAPDSFLEIGAHLGNLLGGYVDFTSIQIRTPEDISLGSFRMTGHWGQELHHAS